MDKINKYDINRPLIFSLPPQVLGCVVNHQGLSVSSKMIRIVEVGPRDGLQNEKRLVPTEVKIELIRRLSETGLSTIEVTSFVSPKWIPQMADASKVLQASNAFHNIQTTVLTPNLKGLERAIASGAKEVAIFGAASEGFSQKNINCSIQESLVKFREVVKYALERGLRVRGYISCIIGCPYDGKTAPAAVVDIASQMIEMGCYEVSLGDTIGIGTPNAARALVRAVLRELTTDQIALHFHDTYGQALANIYACLELGVTSIDTSVAGLGGCPYAKGASGNVATEDVVYMLEGLGLSTGVDLDRLVAVGDYISKQLERTNGSKLGLARCGR